MTTAPHAWTLIAWPIAVFVLFRASQYVLTARTYLTCAARSMEVELAQSTDVGAEERAVLESVDPALQEAGFRFLFTGRLTPFLTYYDGPTFIRVFVSERGLVRAVVRRRELPEAGSVVTVQLESSLINGRTLVTSNFPSEDVITLPTTDIEVVANADVGALDRRHLERLEVCGADAVTASTDLDWTLGELDRAAKALRPAFRDMGYTRPTADPALDGFTVKGAFALAHASMQMLARQKKTGGAAPAEAASDEALKLRAAADTCAVQHIATHPVLAPGSNMALWAVMAATAAVSFAGMSILWSLTAAAVTLFVVAIHEGGHALAMRFAGYRDVNVFFVPMVGALTIGRDTGASVRARLSVIFAGPVPGLWLAVLLLWLQKDVGQIPGLRAFVIGLLAINALNLLPITPFDGGRALEALTKPDSVLRLGIHGASGVGLFALGVKISSTFLMILGALWIVGLARQIAVYRIRRQVRAELAGLTDAGSVVRAACAAFAAPAYSKWRGATRIATVRLLVQQFSQVQATIGDRVKGVFAYVSAWVPVLLALLLWKR